MRSEPDPAKLRRAFEAVDKAKAKLRRLTKLYPGSLAPYLEMAALKKLQEAREVVWRAEAKLERARSGPPIRRKMKAIARQINEVVEALTDHEGRLTRIEPKPPTRRAG